MREQEQELKRRIVEEQQATGTVLRASPQDVELPELKRQRKELEENPSYFWGTIKAVNEGTASFFRTLDNTATTIEDLTGLKKSGSFGAIADHIEEKAELLPETPETVVGDALQDLGHLEGMFLELAVTKGFKIGRLAQATNGVITGVPNIVVQMGASGFLNTYGELTNLNVDQQEKVLESFAALGHGVKEGALLSMLGYGSGKAAQAVAVATKSNAAAWVTGVGVNAGGFGGLTAVEQLITKGDIDFDEVRRNTVLGAALGLPGLPNALFGRAFGNYGTASPRAKVIATKIEVPLEELRERSADLRERAAKTKDTGVKEDLLTQADVVDNLADIKAVTEDIKRDPGRYIEAIEKDKDTTPEEKAFYKDQIDQTVAKEDVQLKEAEPIAEAIEKVEADIKAINGNDLISNPVKAAKKAALIQERVRLQEELGEVFKPKEEVVEEVVEKEVPVEEKPKVEVEKITEQKEFSKEEIDKLVEFPEPPKELIAEAKEREVEPKTIQAVETVDFGKTDITRDQLIDHSKEPFHNELKETTIDEHMAIMGREINRGKTFDQAHDTALQVEAERGGLPLEKEAPAVEPAPEAEPTKPVEAKEEKPAEIEPIEDVTEQRRKEFDELRESEEVDIAESVNTLRDKVRQDVIDGKTVAPELLKELELPTAKEILKEAPPVEPKVAAQLREAAEFVRSGKISKLKGFRAGTGFDKAWDGGLEVIAKSLETGADLAVAIDKGLKSIKASEWFKALDAKRQKFFTDQFKGHIEEEVAGGGIVIPKAEVKGAEAVEGPVPKINEITAEEAVLRVNKMFEKQTADFDQQRKITFKDIRKKTVKWFFDISGNVKRELLKKGGESVVINKDLIAGTSAKSMLEFEKARKEIFPDLSKAQEEVLARIIQARRTIEIDTIRDKRGEPRVDSPGGLHKEFHEPFLESLKSDNLEAFKELDGRADLYFKTMRKQLDKLDKAGLLTKESFEKLKEATNFSPRKFIQFLDPERTSTIEGRTISVTDSGIKSLKQGSTKSLNNDPRTLLAEVISRTNAQVANNKANKALFDFAKENPGNGIVEIQKVIGKTKEGAAKFAKVPSGSSRIDVLIDGKARSMSMLNEFASEWIRRDPLIDAGLGHMLSVASGASILRFAATGANPAFALTNTPRDMAHVLLMTDVYSSVLPVGFVQLAKDMKSVAKDAITRKGVYEEYINEGGGMEFLSQQGRILRTEGIPIGKVKRGMAAVSHVLGYINETSEVFVRLAIRRRSQTNQLKEFKKVNDREPTLEEQEAINRKATWEARNQMDFGQGGSVAKAVDTVIPYTNASLQGTRVMLRFAASNPKKFAFKVAQLGSVATGLYLYNRTQEGWDDVSDITKSMNFVIMLPFYKTNREGQKRWFHLKIPKSLDQVPIAGMFENLAEWTETGKYPTKKAIKDIELGLPRIPVLIDNPPIIDAIWAYHSNWDRFRDDKIWKGNKVEDWAEFNKFTPEFYKEAGKVLDASPERLKRATEKITTNLQNNIYAAMTGQVYRMISDELTGTERDDLNNDVASQIEKTLHPLLRRFLDSTNPKEKGDVLERFNIEENTARKIRNDGVKESVAKFNRGTLTRKEFIKSTKDQPISDRRAMVRMFNAAVKKKGVDFWFTELQFASSPEVKARAFFDRWSKADATKRKEMERTIARIGRIRSKRFNNTFNVLKKSLKE